MSADGRQVEGGGDSGAPNGTASNYQPVATSRARTTLCMKMKSNGQPVVSVNLNPLYSPEDDRRSMNDTDEDVAERGLVTMTRTHCRNQRNGGKRSMTTLEKYLSVTVFLLFAACLAFLYLACIKSYKGPDVCLTAECVKTASSLMAAMDYAADPCEDFFQYACGTWNRRHIIPEDRSSISTFEVMADELQVILKGLLEETLNDNDNEATQKAKLYYRSCVNVTQIQQLGDEPIRRVLDKLGGWPVANANWTTPGWTLETLLGTLRGEYNQGIMVEQWVGPDDKNSSVNIIQLDQMALGLPSREYFLKNVSNKELDAYHRMMVEVAILLGADAADAAEQMSEVLDLERRLANASFSEADRHDTGAIYSQFTLKQLQLSVPQFNWMEYLNTFLPTQVTEDEPVVVYVLPYLREMGLAIEETDSRVIHNYVLWRLLLEFLPFMGDEYQEKRADFRKVLWGISADRVRWNQCVELVNKKMGMSVGALFIRDNFNHDSKETAMEMIFTIREAFNELLQENDWMDDETRQFAREKANAMNERIGYPELLTDAEELGKEYDSLEISEDEFFQNILNALKFEASKNLIKLRQPVNKDKWTTEPAVVNAFYNPNRNDIVFPAGILQPLFYSQHFPKSLNYGGIGVVIGHEMTHGFDDKGRQFDKDGNLKQWWNNATIGTFRERAQCIVDQYSSYILEEVGLPVNGKMTQGENIADNGGLKQAFRAYRKWVEKNGEEPTLPGMNMTHDQLFFLNYAQIWCGSMRPEDALSKIRSSVHSPGPIRVLGPLSNSYDFASAFNCAVGSRMNPENKCTVW